MHWRKMGLIFAPDSSLPWSRTHAMIPTPVLMGDRLRVFYSSCDASGRGVPSYVDLDPDNPARVVQARRTPVLHLGSPGFFDHDGVVASSVVNTSDGRWFMYYVGFELCRAIRYRLLTGLAISDDGSEFRKYSSTPVFERTDAETFFRCGPHVRIEGGVFRAWYVAGSRWTEVDGKAVPEYRIVHSQSSDGISWPSAGEIALDIEGSDEHGLGRPWVERQNGGYTMHYSSRRRSVGYRLGLATSADGLRWQRSDSLRGLDVGPDAFDSQAMMYSSIIEVGARRYCFYNGNDFGREGIALAISEAQ
jgi:hypothetical protein